MSNMKVLLKRGTLAQNELYQGANGEITIDSTNKALRIHDGSTVGGFEILGKAQVLSLTNGLAGDISSVEGDISTIQGQITTINTVSLPAKLDADQVGVANGVAPLGADGKIANDYISDAILGQVEYKGLWDADQDSPALPSADTVKGDYYIVTVAGTYNTVAYEVGDWIISDGTTWGRVKNTDAVRTVAGRTGDIVLTKADVGLADVDNTSDADKPVSTLQQAALDLKAPIASPTFTGTVTVPAPDAASNDTTAATTAWVTARIGELNVGVSSVTASAGTPIVMGGTAVNPTVGIQASSTTQDGYMSSTQATKLDGIAAGAQVNTVDSVAGKTGVVTLVKGDVGLGDVENYAIASTLESQEGDTNVKYATPLSVRTFVEGMGFVQDVNGDWTLDQGEMA